MARPLRIEFDGAWYHVMNRGAGRRLVFRTAAHRTTFLRLLGEISTIYGVEVHAFCLMGNHYHLLLHTPKAGLARPMRHLDGVYTQRFNRNTGTDGPLFRGRYKSVLVDEDTRLCCVSRYIHLNPVEARLAPRPEAYCASSYRAYLGLATSPAWLITSATLSRFEPGDARQSYRRFVESGLDDETRAFYAGPRRRPVLGSEQFRKAAERRLHASGVDRDTERPDHVLVTKRPALDAIAAAVCRAFGLALSDLRPATRRRPEARAARGAFVLLGREFGGRSVEAIAQWTGYRSYAGASKAMSRFRVLLARSSEVRDRVEAARCELRERRDQEQVSAET